jgi:CHRD domain-containing protein
MRRVIFLITLAGALAAMMALSGAAVAQSSVVDNLDLDSPPVTVLRAELTGEEEVPPGDPDGSGSATIIVIPSTNTICYVLTAEDIAPATAAHIHVGGPGEVGDVVVPLNNPPTYGASGGCTQADPALVSNIQENPENYYVNVHNEPYPAGAIRGQLSE